MYLWANSEQRRRKNQISRPSCVHARVKGAPCCALKRNTLGWPRLITTSTHDKTGVFLKHVIMEHDMIDTRKARFKQCGHKMIITTSTHDKTGVFLEHLIMEHDMIDTRKARSKQCGHKITFFVARSNGECLRLHKYVKRLLLRSFCPLII